MSSVADQQARNVGTVREAIEAYRLGELDGLLALAREDFEVYLPPNLPNAGRYVGHEGFVTWLNQWLDAWEDFTIEITEADPVGARHVVAMVHQSGRGKGSGIPVEMDVAYLWDIRDGGLAALQMYATREEALDAAEQRERASGD
jgi:ketosteroid isomerase-like protein